MKNIIQHTAFVDIHNKNPRLFISLFKNTNTISTLSTKIIKLSKDFVKFGYNDEQKMMGDIFEIFTELFFKILSADNRIGVYRYCPVPSSEDYGVDGTGIGMDNLPLTVQAKFRSDITKELVTEDLKQFGFKSIVEYGVDKDTKSNMVLFTNAVGMHWVTDTRVFSSRIRCIGYNEIKILINNNSVFWKDVKDIVDATIDLRYNINEVIQNQNI